MRSWGPAQYVTKGAGKYADPLLGTKNTMSQHLRLIRSKNVKWALELVR